MGKRARRHDPLILLRNGTWTSYGRCNTGSTEHASTLTLMCLLYLDSHQAGLREMNSGVKPITRMARRNGKCGVINIPMRERIFKSSCVQIFYSWRRRMRVGVGGSQSSCSSSSFRSNKVYLGTGRYPVGNMSNRCATAERLPRDSISRCLSFELGSLLLGTGLPLSQYSGSRLRPECQISVFETGASVVVVLGGVDGAGQVIGVGIGRGRHHLSSLPSWLKEHNVW